MDLAGVRCCWWMWMDGEWWMGDRSEGSGDDKGVSQVCAVFRSVVFQNRGLALGSVASCNSRAWPVTAQRA